MHVAWSVPHVAQSARGAVLAQLLELMVREQLRHVESAVFGAGQLIEAAFITRDLLALGGSRHSRVATELVPRPSAWP